MRGLLWVFPYLDGDVLGWELNVVFRLRSRKICAADDCAGPQKAHYFIGLSMAKISCKLKIFQHRHLPAPSAGERL